MKIISFIFFVLILVTHITAQVTQEWVRIYNSPGNAADNSGSVATDAAGNIYVAGYSTSSINNSVYNLIKYNPDGEIIWVRSYNFANFHDMCVAVIVDNEGSIYITGESYSTSQNSDIATIKYDSSGTQLWVQRFGGATTNERANKLAVDGNNNLYVGGYIFQNNIVIKYNSSGVQQWTLPITYTEMTVDNIGNVYLAGYEAGFAKVWKYNTNGSLQWSKNPLGTLESSYGRGVKVDSDGNVFVVMNQAGNYVTVKYNSNGIEQWVQSYQSQTSLFSLLYNIALDQYGNCFLSGQDNTNIATNSSDITTIKYSADGNELWIRTYNGPTNDYEEQKEVLTDNEGNVYVYLESYDTSTKEDILLIKYSPEGDTLWMQPYSTPGEEYPFSFTIDNNYNIYATGSIPDPTQLMDRILIKYSQPQKPRYPVFIVPGVGATYSANIEYDLGWLLKRGIEPDSLQIDPLARVYDDLIITFENSGYVKGKDLFIANYDWRMPPGPVDNNFDGHIDGISAASITSGQFNYGVDYLGWFIKQACERWRQDNNDELDSIDIISHSTGGLVARTYIQSDAYAGIYDNTNNYKLPKVRNLVMLGVPNRGASKPWNPLNDNWIADPAYRFVLSKIINRAYQKVKQGFTIQGPDYSIDLQSILGSNNKPDSILFIQKYVPTIRYLLATYDFIDSVENGVANYSNINDDPDKRNSLVLDLNNGLDFIQNGDPSKFLDSAYTAIIYAKGERTSYLVEKRSDFETNAVHKFTDWFKSIVLLGTIWFKDLSADNNGDGTVPEISSAGQFVGDNRANLIPFFSGNHTEIVSQSDVQSIILNLLDVPFNSNNISTGHSTNYSAVLNVISDPVELVITDGNGNRLGYTNSSGALTEISGSKWFGNTDGMGYVFGSVTEPVNLQLTGLGEDYYVMVSVEDSVRAGGVVLEGFLAEGEVINYQITLDPVSVEQINSIIPQNFALEQNYPNPFNPSTTIQYSIPQRSNVTLKVYDILGNEIAELVNEEKGTGVYSVSFDASGLASGLYLYRLQAGNFVKTKKMILLR